MPWPTWTQAAVAGMLCFAVHVGLRWVRPGRVVDAALASSRELTIVCGLYAFWRVAKHLPFDVYEGAIERARAIVDLQASLGFPTELAAQELILAWDPLGWLSSAYYAGMHVPATIAFLIWLFARHRNDYARWRNRLALTTLGCMIIRFVHVAPPRFLPDLGYVDVAAANGMDVYGPVGTGISAQTVAMPSIHVAWAAVVAFGVVAASSSRWRWLAALHLPITFFVVAATGHHWWLDGVVAIGLLGIAVALDVSIRGARSALGRDTPSGSLPPERPLAARSSVDPSR